MLGIVSRALDQGQRLEDGIVYVGRHLRALFGQRSCLSFREQVSRQAQPPRPEGDHDCGNDQYGPTNWSQGRAGGVAQHEDQETWAMPSDTAATAGA